MKCSIGDSEIFYETRGSGRPIVMLPGRPSDHRIMERFMEPIFAKRDGWLRIYPDLPGTGHTPVIQQAEHDRMLDAMLAFIDGVIPDQRFVIAGFSYGGYMTRGVVAHRATSIDGVMLCVPQVKADLTQAPLPPRTIVVENPTLAAELGPIADLLVVQSPAVARETRTVLTEVQLADHPFNDRLEIAAPASFEMNRLSTPFAAPTLIMAARQDHLCGYRDAWDLLDDYPRATFAVIDRAGHFINIEQNVLCQALMREWLDRVEEATMR